MQISPEGVALVKSFESCVLTTYRDSVGVPTNGWGHTGPDVQIGQTIPQALANENLLRDLRKSESYVALEVKVPLQQHQFDALVSFVFNCGYGNFRKSTLLKKVNAKRFDEVPAEFMKWTRAGGRELAGLVRRRRAEAALWRNCSDNSDTLVEESGASPDRPKSKQARFISPEGALPLIGSASSAVSAASQVSDTVQQAQDTTSAFVALFHNPVALMLIVAAVLFAVWWYMHSQRVSEEAN